MMKWRNKITYLKTKILDIIGLFSFHFAGELTASCMGPNKAAYCELEDNRDGTFELRIKPQEIGRHVLQVKYGGEHVQGKTITDRPILSLTLKFVSNLNELS